MCTLVVSLASIQLPSSKYIQTCHVQSGLCFIFYTEPSEFNLNFRSNGKIKSMI